MEFRVWSFGFRVSGSEFLGLGFWFLVAEGEIEIGDVTAEDRLFKSGIDGHQHDLVGFSEGGREFVQERLGARIAVGLEHDAQTLRLERARHGERAGDFGGMVRVVGEDIS